MFKYVIDFDMQNNRKLYNLVFILMCKNCMAHIYYFFNNIIFINSSLILVLFFYDYFKVKIIKADRSYCKY